MKFKNQSIYNLFLVCIQCFILNCVGENNHMEIYVDCNTVPYENYKCGGNNYSSTNPPCKSLEDAQQVSINLYDEWNNANFTEFSLTILISPCIYLPANPFISLGFPLSFSGYKTVEIKNINNNSFDKVMIVGPYIYCEANFLEIKEHNEVIKISGITFKDWHLYSDIVSLANGTLKSKSIYLNNCIFDNTKVIFSSEGSYPNNFSIVGSNFTNINSVALNKPIFKMIKNIFTMINVNVTNCVLNENQPFIDFKKGLHSEIFLSDITFQNNQMGSFLYFDGLTKANNLQFIGNTIKLSKEYDKYHGLINFNSFGLVHYLLNGFKFQNNTINSPAGEYSNLISIIHIGGCGSGFTFNISNVNISINNTFNLHFLNVECGDYIPKESYIINIIDSKIIMDYIIGGYNFVSFIINTILDVNSKIDCLDCTYTVGSKKTIVSSQTPATPLPLISTESILIIISLSAVVGSLLIFLIMILIRRNNYYKNRKQLENNYIRLKRLEIKTSINNEDEDLLLQEEEEEEEESCGNYDEIQSISHIYYKHDDKNDNDHDDYVNPGRIIVTQIKIPINNKNKI